LTFSAYRLYTESVLGPLNTSELDKRAVTAAVSTILGSGLGAHEPARAIASHPARCFREIVRIPP
jgi:hypothetical protein